MAQFTVKWAGYGGAEYEKRYVTEQYCIYQGPMILIKILEIAMFWNDKRYIRLF